MKKGDLILLLFFLIVGFSWFIFLKTRNAKGERVEIRSEGNVLNLPLKDTTIEIEGEIGKTVIKIKNGKVWVSKACCPKKICKLMGKIEKPGEVIICVPNQIYIEIKGKGLDAVTY